MRLSSFRIVPYLRLIAEAQRRLTDTINRTGLADELVIQSTNRFTQRVAARRLGAPDACGGWSGSCRMAPSLPRGSRLADREEGGLPPPQ